MTEKVMLSRDSILTANDIPTAVVECPEWGGSVRIRALTLQELSDWKRSLVLKESKRNMKTGSMETDYVIDVPNVQRGEVRLIVKAVINEDGKPLFLETDVDTLLQRHTAPLKRLAIEIQRLSKGAFADDDTDEDAEKN